MPATSRSRVVPPVLLCEELLELPHGARGLGMALHFLADDAGRASANPRAIKGQLYTFDDEVSADTVGEWLLLLDEAGYVELYAGPDGRDYVQMLQWGAVADPQPSRRPSPAQAAVAVADGRADRAAAAVRRALDGAPDGMTSAEVRRAVSSRDRDGVDAALAGMCADGRVDTVTVTYRGQTGTRYCLATTTPVVASSQVQGVATDLATPCSQQQAAVANAQVQGVVADLATPRPPLDGPAASSQVQGVAAGVEREGGEGEERAGESEQGEASERSEASGRAVRVWEDAGPDRPDQPPRPATDHPPETSQCPEPPAPGRRAARPATTEETRAALLAMPPPSPFCVKHPAGTDTACRGCATARTRHDLWQDVHAEIEQVPP